MQSALFEGLVSYDPVTFEIVPGIAKSWEFDPADSSLTFHLRDATWSDGTLIDAATFKESWRRDLDLAAADKGSADAKGGFVLKKNPLYWDAASVGLDAIEIKVVADSSEAYKLYAKGGWDWAKVSVTKAQAAEARGRADYHVSTDFATYYYLFNTRRKPFDDARVRKALSLALDRKALWKSIFRK